MGGICNNHTNYCQPRNENRLAGAQSPLRIRVVAHKLRDHRLARQPMRRPENQHVQQHTHRVEEIGRETERVSGLRRIVVVCSRGRGSQQHHERQPSSNRLESSSHSNASLSAPVCAFIVARGTPRRALLHVPFPIGIPPLRVQSGAGAAEELHVRRGFLALAISLALSGCLLPVEGTPVLVDSLAGEYWSGEARLLEVSGDRQRCRIAARNRSMVVREQWVPCTSVHPAISR